jgi:glycerophosphoryl diester phosphodiesterase
MRTLLVLTSFVLAAVLNAQQRSFHIATHDPIEPLICAHRGRLNGTELENSLTVMRGSYKNGIRMMEFDLRESSDEQIFLLHDETLDRTTNASGAISEYDSEQLRRIMQRDLVSGKPVELLTRFNDLLAWARTTNVLLMVDLKDTPPVAAVKAIRGYGLVQRVILLTFDTKTAEAALAASPDTQVSMFVHTRKEIDSAIISAHGHPMALYLPTRGDEALYAYAHATRKIVISDALGELDDKAHTEGFGIYSTYLQRHLVDIFVTNHPLAFAPTHKSTSHLK